MRLVQPGKVFALHDRDLDRAAAEHHLSCEKRKRRVRGGLAAERLRTEAHTHARTHLCLLVALAGRVGDLRCGHVVVARDRGLHDNAVRHVGAGLNGGKGHVGKAGDAGKAALLVVKASVRQLDIARDALGGEEGKGKGGEKKVSSVQ